MRSLRLDLTGAAPRLEFDRAVSGFENTVQKCMVNIGTHKDDRNLFEDKGTDLLRRGAEGSLISAQTAQHESNFAAVKTQRFVKGSTSNSLDASEALARVSLLPTAPLPTNRLSIEAAFTSAAGEVVGITGTI